ncbi:MAG: IS4 family transposase [Lewinellaceae bacterium]|nr:IS4 family transposase [Lewinellaceae bacterium]
MRHLNKQSKISQVSQQLQVLFAKTSLEAEARMFGFVQRERRLGGSAFVQLCIHGVSQDGLACSLTELCAVALDLGIELCAQSLNERFNERGVGFIQRFFERVLDSTLGGGEKLATLKKFNGVYLQDATIYQLPERLKEVFRGSGGGGSQAAVKIDCLTDIQAGKWYLHIKDGASADNAACLLSVPRQSLWLRDLGYFKLDDFQTIANQEAYFASRLRSDIVLETASEPAQSIDLLEWAQKMQEGQIKEAQVWAGGKGHKKGPFRLIVQKVSKELGDAKRHKLCTDKQNKRKGLTKRRLALCDLNIYLTNLDAEEWPARLVVELYRIRWQIEILFKVWKSILKIGKLYPMKPHRFLCLMYAQMAWALLNAKIFQFCKATCWNNEQVELSELKAFKILRKLNHRLLKALAVNTRELYMEFFQLLFKALDSLGAKHPRKTNKNQLFCMC